MSVAVVTVKGSADLQLSTFADNMITRADSALYSFMYPGYSGSQWTLDFAFHEKIYSKVFIHGQCFTIYRSFISIPVGTNKAMVLFMSAIACQGLEIKSNN